MQLITSVLSWVDGRNTRPLTLSITTEPAGGGGGGPLTILLPTCQCSIVARMTQSGRSQCGHPSRLFFQRSPQTAGNGSAGPGSVGSTSTSSSYDSRIRFGAHLSSAQPHSS